MKSIPRFLFILLIFVAALPARGADLNDPQELLKLAPDSSKYPNAGFINLIDEAKYIVRPDGSWSTITRTTARICNERGRGIANVHLAYNSAFEDVKILRARTIENDGTVVEVNPQDVREITTYSGYAMYSSIKAKVMIMPAIENDCIIDYEWAVTGKKSIMPSAFGTGWFFQSMEPTLLSRFTLELPADREFEYTPHNTKIEPAVSTSKNGKTKTFVWEGRDFGEIDPEPYMPPMTEIAPWFDLSSVKSWNEVADWYWKLVEPQMKLTHEIKATVDELIKGKQTDAEKAKAIFYWVEDKIRYVGLEFGASAYEPHSAADVFANRYGDCKDQATLLLTMLRAAGIKAHPVLLAVSSPSKLSERLPFPGLFDHAIAVAEIDGKYVWMDTTAEVCRFGDLPENDRGKEVFVIDEGKGRFVETPGYEPEENGTVQECVITMKPDGAISASVSWTSLGSADLATRLMYKYAKPNKIRESIQAAISMVAPDAQLKDYTTSDPLNRDAPIKAKCDFEATGWAGRAGKLLIFKPSLYQQQFSQTPFSNSERKYPICFTGKSLMVSDTTITLPEGSAMEELPANVSLKADFGAFERTYDLKGDKLRVTERLLRTDARVAAERYAEVRKFFEDVIQAQKQQVVVRMES